MTLLTSAVFPELTEFPDHHGSTTYSLTHGDAGWVLLTRRGDGTGWSTSLARHGASPAAPRRVAQAVGVRVLHELGVEVEAWVPGPDGHGDDVLALVAPAPAKRTLPRGVRGH